MPLPATVGGAGEAWKGLAVVVVVIAAVLGKEKAQLFRDGTPLDRFVDSSGHTYTLDELKNKEN